MDQLPDTQQTTDAHPTLLACLAIGLFFFLFTFKHIGAFDFWWWLSTNILLLILVGQLLDRSVWQRIILDLNTNFTRKILWGLISALVLYGIFAVGDYVLKNYCSVISGGVEQVYDLKHEASFIRISILLIFVIGPGEELLWRGIIQHGFSAKLGRWHAAMLTTIIYAIAHLGSLNTALILAALCCGAFWGIIYAWKRSLLVNMLSHTAWDILVFLLFPFS